MGVAPRSEVFAQRNFRVHAVLQGEKGEGDGPTVGR